MVLSPRVAATLLVLVASVGAGGADPPGAIILSLIDDLGFSDIQPNGVWSPTPHIGQLAEQGVKLQHMHGPPATSRQPEPCCRPGACLS